MLDKGLRPLSYAIASTHKLCSVRCTPSARRAGKHACCDGSSSISRLQCKQPAQHGQHEHTIRVRTCTIMTSFLRACGQSECASKVCRRSLPASSS
eukprot:3032497-Pleurochrysis_carterae.AAC.2